MRVGILTFPGSNCDHDVYHVVKHVSGGDAAYVWHKDRLPATYYFSPAFTVLQHRNPRW